MDYTTASQIRNKGFTQSLTEKLISGVPIGQSVRESISQSMKAKAVGIKQKFDPLNVARVLTGGSNLGPAIIGRLLNRKDEDISFFSKSKGKKNPDYTSIGHGPVTTLRIGDSHADVVAKFYRFMEKDIEFREKRDKEISKYRKEVNDIKERRTNELISALVTGEDIRSKTNKKSSLMKYGVLGAVGLGAMLFSEDAYSMVKNFKVDVPDIFTGLTEMVTGKRETTGGLSFSDLTKEEQDRLLQAQYKFESGGKESSLASRLKNPGAMKYASWMKQYGGTKGEQGFAQFETMEQGRAAQRHLWEKHGARPIEDVIQNVWSPDISSESYKNYVGSLYGGIGRKSEKSSFTGVSKGGTFSYGGITPVEGGVVSSAFGMRTNPRPWKRGEQQMHQGVDIAAPTGTPVKTVAGGKVTFAGQQGNYGNMIEVDHGDGNKTRYAHLSSIDVQVGQTLSGGDIIGKVGNTGAKFSGPHLHFETLQGNMKVNPTSVLAGTETKNIPTKQKVSKYGTSQVVLASSTNVNNYNKTTNLLAPVNDDNSPLMNRIYGIG